MTTPFPRRRLGPVLCACVALLPGLALAQATNSPSQEKTVTSSIDGQPEAVAGPQTREINTQGISGAVTVIRAERPFPSGGSAFAQIELTNTGSDKSADAELVLDAETAVIRGVSGKAVKVREDGRQRIATVEKIVKGKPRKVIVEVELRAGDNPGEASAENGLKVTLRDPGGESEGESATLGWPVTDCAGNFYAEIVKVRAGSGAGIDEAIEATGKRDKTRPGRWLFPPRFKVPGARRKCVRSVKRWSQRRGRHIYVCTKFAKLEPDAGSPVPFEDERKIYRFASRYVSSRAIDREFARTRDTGWATRRVSLNLKGYLGQDRHPAICTGAIPYLDYFDKRLAGFAKRASTHFEMADKAMKLARLRTGEAVATVKNEPGGHPGFGAAPLDLPAPDDPDPKRLVERLAQITGDPELSGAVSAADNTFAALRLMSGYVADQKSKSLAKATRAAIVRALSAIEAADYTGTVAGHYAGLDKALLESMNTIREAHARHCTCSR